MFILEAMFESSVLSPPFSEVEKTRFSRWLRARAKLVLGLKHVARSFPSPFASAL